MLILLPIAFRLMLAVEKHKGTFIAPVGIGLALFVCELSGVYFTGGSLNPARSFGPCVALGSFPNYHWIYWVGPCLGSLIAVGLYRFLKALEYETANPGQDFDDKEAQALDVDEDRANSAKDVQRPDDLEIHRSRQSNQFPGPDRRAPNYSSPPSSPEKVEPMHPGYEQQTYDNGPSMEGNGTLGGRYRVSGL